MRYLRETAVKLLEIAAEMEDAPPVAAARAKGCTCDVCGSQLYGGEWDGLACMVPTEGGPGGWCPGVYRLDPEPAKDRAGNDLGVSLADLAEQGLRDFLADDPDWDEITEDWPDIASTYRGRRG